VVIAAPALQALRRAHPKSRITLLVEERVAEYARHCPWVDEVLALRSFDVRSWRGWLVHGRTSLAVLARLRQERFDVAANLYEISSSQGRLKMSWLFRIVAPGLSVGRDTLGRGSFYDVKVDEVSGDGKSHGDYYAEVARALGSEVDPREKASLWLPADAGLHAERFLSDNGVASADTVIGINPTSSRVRNLWPAESFARLADRLAQTCGAKIVLIGAPCDSRGLREIAALMHSPSLQTADALDLEAKMALVRRCRLLVTTHSAFMHVANSFAVPFLCLSNVDVVSPRDGPYRPDPQRHVLIKTARGAVSGLGSISVEQAFESAKALLSPAGKNGRTD
jgi:ADP-heptose:LPS heptosyltransferase